MNLKVLFPCVFTVGNLLCGFLAIANAVHEDLTVSAWLILLGALFDGLDGWLARAIGGDTRFGREFDSFADFISFGVAPMVILYHILIAEHGFVTWIICGIFLIAGAFRLVRFNITYSDNEVDNYIGLPITSCGILLAGFILFSISIYGYIISSMVLIILLLALSLLMVSRLAFKKINSIGRNAAIGIKFLLFIPVVLLLIVKPQVMILLVMVIYISMNLLEEIGKLFLSKFASKGCN